MPGSTVEELAHEEDYIETCRTSAWCELPHSKTLQYWDHAAKDYRFPEGWPPGVDPESYVQAKLEPVRRSQSENPTPAVEATPSVARFRQMIGEVT